jgi:hypothetical protein
MPHHKTAQRRVVHWRAPEFLYKEKTPLWYTNVSVFFFVVLLALFLINNYVGVGVILLAAWVFLANSNDKPRTVDYTVDRKGIKIDDRVIAFSDIESFSINVKTKHPVVLLDLHYPFSLPVTVVIKEAEFDTVVNILLDYVPLKHDNSILRWLAQILHY